MDITGMSRSFSSSSSSSFPDICQSTIRRQASIKRKTRVGAVLKQAMYGKQCDQIWQFIELWASFYSLWEQLICPNLPHSQAIFGQVSKSSIFILKSFWATLIDIWRFFSGHTAQNGQVMELFSRWKEMKARVSPIVKQVWLTTLDRCERSSPYLKDLYR